MLTAIKREQIYVILNRPTATNLKNTLISDHFIDTQDLQDPLFL